MEMYQTIYDSQPWINKDSIIDSNSLEPSILMGCIYQSSSYFMNTF